MNALSTHHNITTLITLQSGFEWFELFGLSKVVPVLQVASVCFSSFLVVSSCSGYVSRLACGV